MRRALWVSSLHAESSDDSSSSDSGEEEEEEEVVRVIEWKPSGPQQALGEWEKYTTVSLLEFNYRSCSF